MLNKPDRRQLIFWRISVGWVTPRLAHEVKTGGGRTTKPSYNFSDNYLDKRRGILLTMMSVLLIFSRVYCGTHYPLDVLGGVGIGLLGSYLANKLWPRVE